MGSAEYTDFSLFTGGDYRAQAVSLSTLRPISILLEKIPDESSKYL